MSARPVARLLSLLALSLPTLVVALLAAPTPAYAREYQITNVQIEAEVDVDGTLYVVETRTFDFDGEFNGVYWDIPTGVNWSNGNDVEVEVLFAGEGDADDLAEFGESSAGIDGTYDATEESDVLRVRLFSAHEDEQVSFTLAYAATGIVTRWEDTGELYWKFVSDGWDVESQNVRCALTLPVDDGESVEPGENVRAWGHGPLDATVSFDGDQIVFDVPGVGTEEFAEMRVTFPTSWVRGLDETPGYQLERILSEEQGWADEANARRAWASVAYYGTFVLSGVLSVGTIVVTALRMLRYRRESKPQFSDPYFRDVPTTDHPAVLGALFNGGSPESKELTATLMRLTDEGVVRLDKLSVRKKGLLGEKAEDDYLLTQFRDLPEASGEVAETARYLDKKTLTFLFAKVAGDKSSKTPRLRFSELEAYAKERPQGYSDAYESWKGAVEGSYLERFAGKGELLHGKNVLLVLTGACFVGGVAAIAATVEMEAPMIASIVAVLALFASGGLALAAVFAMQDLSREALEVRAQLEALRRWLREFTRLDEAVPTDVVLWNRLLVMAVVLGVADEVIDQLKVAAPQMLNDPYLMPTYGWLYWHGRDRNQYAPAGVFSKGLDSAHHVSAAAVARSSWSSGGGGGGGFSGGGGGGHGGGGGGGAF